LSTEAERLAEADGTGGAWRNWGPWLAERAWGTVREDYSASGDAWTWLSYEQARSTAYRWNEDGFAGLCDRDQQLCFSLSFWNGIDATLKERAFGLTNGEGNHGEDVKDEYWYVDATPTASWLSWRAHFPQGRYPYEQLRAENARRGREVSEYKLVDTGALDERWEVGVDVAKENSEDLLIRIRVTNVGSTAARLHVLPTLWFRNTWSWGTQDIPPSLTLDPDRALTAAHDRLGTRQLVCDDPGAKALFCDNETNRQLRYGVPGPQFPTDGIGDHVTTGAPTVNPDNVGTKAAYWSQLEVAVGETRELRLRLGRPSDSHDLGDGFAATMALRRAEADAFHADLLPLDGSAEKAAVVRQSVAGLVWSHCYYGYDVDNWLDGDPTQPPPPAKRADGRNGAWRHLHAADVISMPDAWEYPWFASWDLAFQAAALAQADPAAARDQLLLLLSDRYLSPNGAIPAYEWSFSDVNPPLQAWSALAIAETLPLGAERHQFLQQVLHKLLLTFGWWVNRLDPEGRNLFQGGFLGLDNVGPFDRSHQPPGIGLLEQSDATAWTAMFCLDLAVIAVELAVTDPVYEDLAVTFVEHFAYVAAAMNDSGLWDDEDGFCYDLLRRPDGSALPLRVRSIAGLVVLGAVRAVPASTLDKVPRVAERLAGFLKRDAQYAGCVHSAKSWGGTADDRSLVLSVLPPDRMRRLLTRMLDEDEFLSPHGLRSMSKWHLEHPYLIPVEGFPFAPVTYEPGESRSGMYGGNSNWRGPVWLPLNLLAIAGLYRLGSVSGDGFRIELPTGSGSLATLPEVTANLIDRLVGLYLPGPDGKLPAAGDRSWPPGLLWLHEYFHGDTGAGLGASHQTGWTAGLLNLLTRPTRERPKAQPG
jgi:hypothetical protein